ncbi:hypothetical protein [Thermosulfurimonas dismutans]|uniref:tRNA (5-methylaminomethyl-2-thiouridylate)-methyltransferase n=1 Tax=Thermosulfurimonas dismutans TaxID=999894 RepID=A0A179D279_9BACT|nr:hypothetical protein [Thermosulfurimonas dismutans]OAQ20175.1 tRNA (5-methylaminomethyl-2-thiouridylate)-methyltransferase [Thermosulfurimonas dismutans]
MLKARVLLLFSGGLDSILAGKVLQAQGLEVLAVRFITPFFHWQWRGREEEFDRMLREKYGFRGLIRDISEEYLELMKDPPHGFGSAANPCIDCKILMLRKAREMLSEVEADFLATGEVVGQRPMSQRRNIMRHIEKEAGVTGILLRPLCAKRLPPTEPEKKGLVDRDRLYDFCGRGRKPQMRLAEEFGITDYPSPAGGCILTDPQIGERLKRLLALRGGLSVREAELALFGRHFIEDGFWLILGRKEFENRRLQELARPGDRLFKIRGIPGPTALLVEGRGEAERVREILKRYTPKARGLPKVELEEITP